MSAALARAPEWGDAIEAYRFDDDGLIPNNPLPLVVMRRAVESDGADVAAAFEHSFARNGWTGLWRNGIFSFHHYHSTAHEVLGIAAGEAAVRFGGEEGQTVEVGPGDVVVIPAGVGHKLVEQHGDLLVVGAYADGREPDTLPEDAGLAFGARQRIAAVPLPQLDPISGENGPLFSLWS
jgi:uncharacterized protein YjlB